VLWQESLQRYAQRQRELKGNRRDLQERSFLCCHLWHYVHVNMRLEHCSSE
jgi:hypothetical protein